MIKIRFEWKNRLGWKRTMERSLPTHYREMSAKQFYALTQLAKNYISEDTFYMQYLGVSAKVLKKIDAFQLYMITSRLRIDDRMLNFFVVKNLGKLVGPEEKLKGMSFQQFITVDTYFGWYCYKDERSYLEMMLANLYIEQGKDFYTGDRTKRMLLIREMKDSELYPAIVNWMMVKNWLAHIYKDLFSASTSVKNVVVQGKEKKQRPGNWLEVFDALVGDNLAFIEEYKHLECMDALRILNSRIKKQKKNA